MSTSNTIGSLVEGRDVLAGTVGVGAISVPAWSLDLPSWWEWAVAISGGLIVFATLYTKFQDIRIRRKQMALLDEQIADAKAYAP